MMDTLINSKRTMQWKTSTLLGASIVGGCLTIVAPVFADTDTDQMKTMQDKLDSIQTELSQMTEGLATHSSNEGLPMHGFMDIGFADNSQGSIMANPNVPNPRGFYEGRLSFYLAPHFGDRVLALAEPNFEVGQSEGTVNVDIERLQVGYAFNDSATLWGGRFHTPYGYWNTAFHHGAQLQTAVLRPRFLDFEDSGGILPAHMVGVWVTGKIKAGEGRFTYDGYVGNGPKIAGAQSVPTPIVNSTDYQTGGLDPNIAGDDNHSAMAGFNLGYDFAGNLDGLRLAVHWLQGDVNAYGGLDPTPTTTSQPSSLISTTTLNFAGGSLVYLSNDWEIMGEYYHFNDDNKFDNVTGVGPLGKHKSWADYIQIGKNFDDFVPFVRFERTVLNQNDNYFSMQASGQSYAREVLGLRYNLSQKAALKFELGNSNFEQEPGRTALGYRSFLAQYAIAF